jgi:hypothetical protein
MNIMQLGTIYRNSTCRYEINKYHCQTMIICGKIKTKKGNQL